MLLTIQDALFDMFSTRWSLLAPISASLWYPLPLPGPRLPRGRQLSFRQGRKDCPGRKRNAAQNPRQLNTVSWNCVIHSPESFPIELKNIPHASPLFLPTPTQTTRCQMSLNHKEIGHHEWHWMTILVRRMSKVISESFVLVGTALLQYQGGSITTWCIKEKQVLYVNLSTR